MGQVQTAGERTAPLACGAVVDCELRLIEFDTAFAQILGVTPDHLYGQCVSTVLPTLEAPLRLALATGQPYAHIPLALNGAAPLLLQLTPLHTARGTLAGVELLAYRSSADHDSATAPLLLPSARAVLDSLFAFAGVLLPDGTLIEANRTALQAAGLSPADVLGKPFPETYWWAYDPTVQARLAAAIACAARGETVRYDVLIRLDAARFTTIDFMLAPLRDPDGQVRFLIPSAIDIAERKQTELALRASERHLTLALSAAQMGTWEIDLVTEAVRCSPGTDRLFGIEPPGSVDRVEGYLARVHPDDRPRVAEAIRRTIDEGAEHAVEYRVVWPDGSVHWLASRGELVSTPDGRPQLLTGALLDITAQQAAEAEREALLQREREARARADEALALLDTLLTTAPVGLCFLSPDYRFLRINAALAEMNGWPAADHLGRTVREVLPDLAQTVEPLLDRVLATGEPLVELEVVEERASEGGGQRIWRASYYPVRLADGTIAGIGIVADDITEQRRAEAALRESEARYRALADLVPAFLFTTRADGWNDYISQSFYDFTGAPAGSADGSGWTAYVHPNDRDYAATLWQAALVGERSYVAEYRFRRKDGQYRWFRSQALPYRDAEGVVVRWFGAALDIDDTKRAEAEREAMLVRERAAVEARDTFIAIASHDLRSPLTALLGRAELLARQASQEALPERAARSARVIAEQARRLNRMLGALLDLSRIQSGQLTLERRPLELAALVARCVGEVEATTSNHRITRQQGVEEVWVAGDEVRLEQVVLNLLGNAVKYSPDGGTITVRVDSGEGEAEVAVEDQGIGIPAEALPRLFERFYRAANASAGGISGLGIGLYAVREIVTLHGGRITVASKEGHGSSFVVRLPLAAQEEGQQRALEGQHSQERSPP